MNQKENFALVLITAPNLKTARRLAKLALQARLVACANLIPRIESLYWWKGKMETGAETLALFKTSPACLTELEKLIIAQHPYDTPEFIVLSIARGNKRYLDWVRLASTGR